MYDRLLAALLTGFMATSVSFAQDWPQLRGPGGTGAYASKQLPPDRWGPAENIAWKIEIPGEGWSSPIVAGGRVYLTSCVGQDKVDAPKTGFYAPEKKRQPEVEHRWLVFCFDAVTGEKLWERVAHKGVPQHSIHIKASYAPETPVTDGERVYAFFGNVGLFCYDKNGNAVWSKTWEVMPTRLGWGTGASPVLYKDRIYLVNDNEKDSFITALDKLSGKEIWKVARDEKSNWATPFIWQNARRTEIVTSGTNKARSYDLDGNLLWELGGMSSICVPMPVAGHGLLYVSSGYEYGRPRPVFAVRPGAAGDISLAKGQTENEFIASRSRPARIIRRRWFSASNCTSCTLPAFSLASRRRPARGGLRPQFLSQSPLLEVARAAGTAMSRISRRTTDRGIA